MITVVLESQTSRFFPLAPANGQTSLVARELCKLPYLFVKVYSETRWLHVAKHPRLTSITGRMLITRTSQDHPRASAAESPLHTKQEEKAARKKDRGFKRESFEPIHTSRCK